MLLQGMPPKLRDSEKKKILWTMVHKQEYQNLNCNGLVAVMGNTLSRHIYIPLYELFKHEF
jgi:hypothetical protein